MVITQFSFSGLQWDHKWHPEIQPDSITHTPGWCDDGGDNMSLTWNFSSSEVTSPWALARGVWHLSMQWCTWDMESEGLSQHSALQRNMRPCNTHTHTELRDATVQHMPSCQDRWDQIITCMPLMWSLSRLWTMSSTSFCMRAWWASAMTLLSDQSSLTHWRSRAPGTGTFCTLKRQNWSWITLQCVNN